MLVTILLALGMAGTARAGFASAQDVVANVTAGANDPVSGATVVARDDRTGRVVSNATTTGNLGYTVIRLRPGASTRRITVTATGGTSVRVLYSRASARRKTAGAWKLTIEARDAEGGVATKVIPIRVR
ncbi:MAG: hypothetical protein O3B97_01825, partial [Actinomycetota bacterium]|nr:hypothetical protein [Actinomycetota bacterium]